MGLFIVVGILLIFVIVFIATKKKHDKALSVAPVATNPPTFMPPTSLSVGTIFWVGNVSDTAIDVSIQIDGIEVVSTFNVPANTVIKSPYVNCNKTTSSIIEVPVHGYNPSKASMYISGVNFDGVVGDIVTFSNIDLTSVNEVQITINA
jgi:hypothetical protein